MSAYFAQADHCVYGLRLWQNYVYVLIKVKVHLFSGIKFKVEFENKSKDFWPNKYKESRKRYLTALLFNITTISFESNAFVPEKLQFNYSRKNFSSSKLIA